MAKSGEKIFMDPEIGEVTFRKSARCRRISIRVHPVKGVTVSMPRLVPYSAAQLFFKAKRDWVLQTILKQKEKFKDVYVASPEEIEALRRQAKAELPLRLAELASRYGFVYNRLAIKHNSTNWGSCSTRGNINLNLNIVRLPAVLQDYILLHELCHLRYHDHGEAFHRLLEELLADNLLRRIPVSVCPDAAVCLSATATSSAVAVPAPAAVPASATPSLGVSCGGRKAEERGNAFLPAATDSAPLWPSATDPYAMDLARCATASVDSYALSLARKAAASKAKYPVDHTLSKEIKAYRLL